jgi:hypothetical protein
MFDKKKLEAFLDALRVETHLPSVFLERPRSALDEKMDKYDIYRQLGYENVGTLGFPLWVKRDNLFAFTSVMQSYSRASFPTHVGISKSAFANFRYAGAGLGMGTVNEYGPPPVPIKTPYDELKENLGKLANVPAAQLANPVPPAPAVSPDFTQTITAWRGWSFENGLLGALGTEFTWEPRRVARACCKQEAHPAPSKSCSCGFWSFKTRELLTAALSNYAMEVDVIGQVEIWGRVVECENGFRSEFAYPKELWLLGDDSESLSWKYGVPVRRLS